MKQKMEKKWVAPFILAAVCLIQLCFFISVGSQKSHLMCDELFTYGAANCRGGIMMDFPLNEWRDKGDYMEYVTPGEDAFSYEIPYDNQAMDVHPPLYYYLIHTIASMYPDTFSFWTGVGLNLVLLLGCTVALYFLVKELFGSKVCALLVSACYGLTYGALNTMLFIRMYMLFAVVLLLHLLVYAKYWEKPGIPKKGYLFLGLTLVAGALTQYYFLIAAFFLAAWYTIKLLLQKRWKETGCYLGTIAVSAGVSLALFPPMWNQIFHGTRGTQAQETFLMLKGYAKSLLGMFQIISSQMFRGYLGWLLGTVAVLLVIYSVWKKRLPVRELSKTLPVIFMAAGYFLLVTKVAPYITDRYMMPIYPVVFLLVFGFLYWLVRNLLKKEVISALVCAALGLFLCLPQLKGQIPGYAYSYVQPHADLLREYADKKAVYIDREFYWWEYYDIVQLMKEHDAYYVISYSRIVQEWIDSALEATGDDDEVIVYIGNSGLDEEIKEYIQETLDAREMVLLDQYSRWTIYRAVR